LKSSHRVIAFIVVIIRPCHRLYRALEDLFVVNVVVVVIFRLRSKLRRTAGALAQAVVNAVGSFTAKLKWISGSDQARPSYASRCASQ
jgi:hypothetical protein